MTFVRGTRHKRARRVARRVRRGGTAFTFIESFLAMFKADAWKDPKGRTGRRYTRSSNWTRARGVKTVRSRR
jgi:hypothetical protein